MFLLWHPSLTAINLSYTVPIIETSATVLCGTTGNDDPTDLRCQQCEKQPLLAWDVLLPPVFGLGILNKNITCWWMSHNCLILGRKNMKTPTIVKGGCSGIRDVPKFAKSRCFHLCFFAWQGHNMCKLQSLKKNIRAFMRSCGSIFYFKPEIRSVER